MMADFSVPTRRAVVAPIFLFAVTICGIGLAVVAAPVSKPWVNAFGPRVFECINDHQADDYASLGMTIEQYAHRVAKLCQKRIEGFPHVCFYKDDYCHKILNNPPGVQVQPWEYARDAIIEYKRTHKLRQP
jgi:hypothetical protein